MTCRSKKEENSVKYVSLSDPDYLSIISDYKARLLVFISFQDFGMDANKSLNEELKRIQAIENDLIIRVRS